MQGLPIVLDLPVITAAARAQTMPSAVDAAMVDQLFAVAGRADQPLSFVGHSAPLHDGAVNGALDTLLTEQRVLESDMTSSVDSMAWFTPG